MWRTVRIYEIFNALLRGKCITPFNVSEKKKPRNL